MPGLGDLIGNLQRAQSGQRAGAGGAGLEDLLGSMLGGAGGSGASAGGLGDLLGGALGGRTGSPNAGAGSSASLLAMLAPLLGALLANGGLDSILGGMRAQGLSAQADSWVSTAPNLPIDADQIRGVLGDDRVAQFAQQLGVDGGQAAGLLAQVLPNFVNSVTPDGSQPPSAELEGLASLLGNLR